MAPITLTPAQQKDLENYQILYMTVKDLAQVEGTQWRPTVGEKGSVGRELRRDPQDYTEGKNRGLTDKNTYEQIRDTFSNTMKLLQRIKDDNLIDDATGEGLQMLSNLRNGLATTLEHSMDSEENRIERKDVEQALDSIFGK